MTMIINVAAVDIGASSGVIIVGSLNTSTNQLTTEETYRFPNKFVRIDHQDCWLIDELVAEIKKGLQITVDRLKESHQSLSAIAIDTWGVDYILLDKDKKRLAPAVAYRDQRASNVYQSTVSKLGQENIYSRTGIQFMPINTLYHLQALALEDPSYLAQVEHFLMIPDYLSFELTGNVNVEYTNATTTQILNVHTDDWDHDLLEAIGIPMHWFTKPQLPGNKIGDWVNQYDEKVAVFSCASHDTASAVLATPLSNGTKSAYLSSGTWSLMGIEKDHAITNELALDHNLTNEGGYEKRFRILKNIMGLWLFQQYCYEQGITDICEVICDACELPAFTSLINPNDARFLNPESMTDAINSFCMEHGQPIPKNHAEYARTIFDSLALLYAQVLNELETVAKEKIAQINIVGGGCQNELLNQMCADICGLNVYAGPIEASALGNMGSQFISLKAVPNLDAYRDIIFANFAPKQFTPSSLPELATIQSEFSSLLSL